MKSKKIIVVFVLAFVSVLTAFSVYSFQRPVPAEIVFPAGSTFEKEWRRVDSLAAQGLNRSALELVNAIYAKARKENNAPQFVKAIIHRMKFEEMMEEYSLEKALIQLKAEADSTSFPVKPVLQSMLAESYWNYYQQNRWQFYERSATVEFNNSDISTWDLKTIVEQVILNYNLSLQNEDSLKRTSLNIYDAVLHTQKDSRNFRPTLYDFLAHRAVDFFMNEETGLNRPAEVFEVSSDSYFWDAEDFTRLELVSKDTQSLSFHGLRILQNLLNLHLNDKDPKALVDADLKRLHLVHAKSTSSYKDSLYRGALRKLENSLESKTPVADVKFQLAQFYSQQASLYQPLQGELHRLDNRVALELCDEVIKNFPGSDGAVNAASLKAQLLARDLSFNAERVNIPLRPFRALVTFRNVKKIYVRVAEIDFERYEKLLREDYNEKLIESFVSLKPIKEFEVELPDDGDMQTHSAEIRFPELAFGHYLLLAASEKSFSTKNQAVAYTNVWNSNISYVNRRRSDGSMNFFVQNRLTGAPLQGATAHLYYDRYDYESRKYVSVKSDKFVTDEKGAFTVPPAREYRNFQVDISFKYDLKTSTLTDRVRSHNTIYQYEGGSEERRSEPRTVFFLDRSIYRPGQTIYFKGIMIRTDGEKNTIMPSEATTVTLYDVNSQPVSELKLKTNEYGTFSGSFTAPAGLLNGQMSIQNSSGYANFSVEDYKRPKFEVSFLPVTGSYRLRDSVRLTGKAVAFSGARLDGAAVSYRIVRNATFPPWLYYMRGSYPRSAEAQVATGSAVTNDTGAFFVNFKAIPDEGISKDLQPTFSYTIYADVTDINGETHSSETNVSAGYAAMTLGTSVPALLEKEKKSKFVIYSNNMNGVLIPASGNVEIYRLKPPAQVYRERLWERPDRFILSETDYRSSFPFDQYRDDYNMYKWQKEQLVYSASFNNKTEPVQKYDSLSLGDLSSWPAGAYVLQVKSKDAFGEEVNSVQYFTVFSSTATSTPSNLTFWNHLLSNQAYEPGETAKLIVGSREQAQVLFELEKDDKIIRSEFIYLNNSQRVIDIPVLEGYRGNVAYHLCYVKNNRSYSSNGVITVPYTNKQLDVSFETFRDKLLPGQQEEWKIKIRDKKGDKVAAEMMTTLYDASLDAFRPHSWYFNIYNSSYSNLNWETYTSFGTIQSHLFHREWNVYPQGKPRLYDRLNWFGYNPGSYYRGYDDNLRYESVEIAADQTTTGAVKEERAKGAKHNFAGKASVSKNAEAAPAFATATTVSGVVQFTPPVVADELEDDKDKGKGVSQVKARSNFSETAFFYPQMETDAEGNLIIKFTIPEALTKWKLLGLAHTKDLKSGTIERELITQKELMVVPNAPRFFRENDEIDFSAKISNLSAASMKGTSQLIIYDALSGQDITGKLNNTVKTADFSINAGKSTTVSWKLKIPEGLGAVTYKVVAKANNFTDGEEMTVPVLTNRILITESMPVSVRGKQQKNFRFEKLISQSNGSSTLRNHSLTFEFTSNPAWYAVQSLPYLMEYPYECSEQIFSRYYANSIASHLANSKPKIKAVFESWRDRDPKALVSNLEKNQELKSLLLEETPWVLDAKDETERKKRLGLLFDLNKMSSELDRSFVKLSKMQSSNGGWPWFEGMPDDRYITQHVVTGLGKLNHLGIRGIRHDQAAAEMAERAVHYLDNRLREDYEEMLKYHKTKMDEDHINGLHYQYLYARSFFPAVEMQARNKKAYEYFMRQAKKYWLKQNRYLQGMCAIAMNRAGDKTFAAQIMKSLKENSVRSEEMGMYWKENYGGYYWYQAPVETQALLIEAFNEVAADVQSVDELRIWLLRSKQTQNWETTRATADACYALLLSGTDWLETSGSVEISLGGVKLDAAETKGEAGTGYFKKTWPANAVSPKMGEVTLKKADNGISWGAVYWQYFEQMDKVTHASTPLNVKKQLFLQKSSASGPVLQPITDQTALKPGDKLRVRIELRVDRDMEYVHMKDMRASGFEPTNVISMYKYQDGLSYYESTRDAATNFFFSYLPKGSYVFEYPLVVSHSGDFSNGVTTVQCMYAPEFSSHSEGIRVKVGK